MSNIPTIFMHSPNGTRFVVNAAEEEALRAKGWTGEASAEDADDAPTAEPEAGATEEAADDDAGADKD